LVDGAEGGLRSLLSGIRSYAGELGLDLSRPEDRFKWFLASMLYAKRISAEIARRTYRRFEEEGLTTPRAILEAGWDRLVEVLDSGGYTRYDFSTASNLLEAMNKLIGEYGDLEGLHEASADPRDLERRLMEFRGIGPVGVNIFLRELRGIWAKADPEPSRVALEVASRLGVKDVKHNESALVRIGLECCRKRRCTLCKFNGYCSKLEIQR
jgi:endonuclease III